MYVYTMDNEKEVLKENLHTPIYKKNGRHCIKMRKIEKRLFWYCFSFHGGGTYKFTVRAGSHWTVVQYSFFFCSPEVRIYKRTQKRKKKRKKTRCRPRTDKEINQEKKKVFYFFLVTFLVESVLSFFFS